MNNREQHRDEKKHKKALAKQEELKEKIIQTKLDSWHLSKTVESGEQLFSASTEQRHILERLIELKDHGKANTPEFKQLLDRYDMIETFRKKQQVLFDVLRK